MIEYPNTSCEYYYKDAKYMTCRNRRNFFNSCNEFSCPLNED